MAKHILKFSKSETVKYVSHLDLVRMFGRAMRRAGVDLSFSQGFNPHPIMNFAHPLGVGISSECELIEIGVEGEITPEQFSNQLSESMPDGFKLLAAKKSEQKSPFAGLSCARYEIELFGSFSSVEPLLEMKEIITEKKTKSGVKETDIRPMIISVKTVLKDDNRAVLDVILKCGETNLKPELFVKVIEETGCGNPEFFKICRKELLNADQKPLIDF